MGNGMQEVTNMASPTGRGVSEGDELVKRNISLYLYDDNIAIYKSKN